MAVGLRCGLQGTIFAQDIHDDALDTGLGRPPIGKVPMTGAERVRLYRLKHAAAKPVPKPTADKGAAQAGRWRVISNRGCSDIGARKDAQARLVSPWLARYFASRRPSATSP